MKKAIAALLLVLLLLSTALCASAQDKELRVNDVQISIEVSNKWRTASRDSISDKLRDETKMTRNEVIEYLKAYDIYLWMVYGDLEFEVTSKKAEKNISFTRLNSAELNSQREELIQTFLPLSSLYEVSSSEIVDINSVPFIKYKINSQGPFGLFYYTIMNGNIYSVNLRTNGSKLDNFAQNDALAVAQALALAVKAPEQHSAQLSDLQEENSLVAGDGKDTVLDLQNTEASSSEASGSEASGNKSLTTEQTITQATGEQPSVSAEGETTTRREIPLDGKGAKSSLAVIGIALGIVAVAAIIVIIIKNKKRAKEEA